MVSILFPMGVIFAFERRSYKLGETINLVIELVPRRDIEVREARVDLVRYKRYTEVTTLLVPPLPSRIPRGTNLRSMAESRYVGETHTDTDVHSSIVVVRNGRLSSGEATAYNVGLEIPPERPTHNSGRTRWRLVATVDIVGARNVTARRLVKVLA